VALTIPSVEEDRWLSPLEAANDLGIARKDVCKMIHRRELQALATGGSWRIRQRVLQTHMLRQEPQAGAAGRSASRRETDNPGDRPAVDAGRAAPLSDNEVLCAREDEGHDHD
jgi:excisionase family DNA binding protein